MSKTEQVNFFFSCQLKKSSKYGVLLTYINQDESDFSRNELILHSLAAFWLPFAYKYCTNASRQEIKQIALSAVEQLKRHIQFLEDSFELRVNSHLLEVVETEHKPLSASANEWYEIEDFETLQDLKEFKDEDEIFTNFTS